MHERQDTQNKTDILMSALMAMQDRTAKLETSLSAETRLKLDLFSALGDARRQMEIMQSKIYLSHSKSNNGPYTSVKAGFFLSLVPGDLTDSNG